MDTNIFIEAFERYYSFDICPGYWRAIENNAPEKLVSIDKVRDEIKGDELADWVESIQDGVFLRTDTNEVIQCFAEAIQWVNSQERFDQAAVELFAQETNADGWLVAFAKSVGAVVVTHEVSAKEGKKIKIPDVCEALGVNSINTFEMLRRLSIEFN